MSSSSSAAAAAGGRLHGDDTPPQSDADAASSSTPPSDQLRLHICGTDYAGSSGTNDEGDRATFFGNPCLDLFLLEDRDAAQPQRVRGLLADAWDQDAPTALKVVCHRHTVKRGHTSREGFFAAAAAWMLQTHPRVFVDNIPAFAALGYVQDLADLLHRLDVHVNLPPAPAGLKRASDHDDDDDLDVPATTSSASSVPPARKRARHDPGASASASATATGPPTAVLRADPAAPPAAVLRADPAAPPAPVMLANPAGPAPPSAAAAHELATTDKPPYRTLYDAIVDFFVNRLRSDLDHLNNGNTSMISLAADWCPSMASPSDQTTLLRTDIARRLFHGMDPKHAHLKDDEDRDNHGLLYLRDSVLVPLVSALHKHKQQASESESEAAKAKVRSNCKLPHLIAGKFATEVWDKQSDQEKKETIEEWRAIVDGLRAKGSLSNCIAVCDVTADGLKNGDSLKLVQVCVTLGLLISELTDEPWKNWLHAFSEGDGSHSLADKTSYTEKVKAIREMECDETFNLRKVFDWVLSRASSNKIDPKNMVKKIFVFTGKDFEQAIVPPSDIMRPEDRRTDDFDPEDARRWSDDYRIVCDKFKQKGYDDCVPGVVLWNLMGDRSPALTSTPKHGVMSLSGYSDNLMRLFLEKGGVVHAEDEMDAAIAREEYQKLEVKEDS